MSQWLVLLRRALVRRKTALVGLVLLASIVLTALLAPFIAPADPRAQTLSQRLKPPSASHLLGTDQFGRDILSRIIWGTQISLLVGIGAVAVGLGIGVVLGLVAGYFGGTARYVIMRIVDALLSFPAILIGLAIMSALGPKLTNVVIAVGISIIPRFARVTYGSVLAIREIEYVEAARAIGQDSILIMTRHVLPNVLGPIIVLATLSTASAILTESTLSFLGMGVDPATPTWGSMVSGGRAYLRDAPWISSFGGFAIMLTTVALNLLGDGLRDAFDPRMGTTKT